MKSNQKENRKYKAYLINIITKGQEEKAIIHNKKKAVQYIHNHLEKHYIDYNKDDYYKYQTLSQKIEKSPQKKVTKQTKESYITIQKFIII